MTLSRGPKSTKGMRTKSPCATPRLCLASIVSRFAFCLIAFPSATTLEIPFFVPKYILQLRVGVACHSTNEKKIPGCFDFHQQFQSNYSNIDLSSKRKRVLGK